MHEPDLVDPRLGSGQVQRFHHVGGLHRRPQQPGDDVARGVIQHRRQVVPAPADHRDYRPLPLRAPAFLDERIDRLEAVRRLQRPAQHPISTDQTLADTQIRVLGQASDYLRLVSRRAEAGLESGTAVPGAPSPPDYLGTRQARRFKMDAGVEVRLGGTPITLADLSRTGAYVVGPIALRPHQRIVLSLATSELDLNIAASVMWVIFEPRRGDRPPRYRAGVKFIDANTGIIEAFSVRHRQK